MKNNNLKTIGQTLTIGFDTFMNVVNTQRDENGRIIMFKNSIFSFDVTYDENGYLKSIVSSSGLVHKYSKMNDGNTKVSIIDDNEHDLKMENIYDTNGNIITQIIEGIVTNFEYDENGNITHEKNNDGYEAWYNYENNILVSKKDNQGNETIYNDKGQIASIITNGVRNNLIL